jgi:NADH-quinone oxidoreductase subunit L
MLELLWLVPVCPLVGFLILAILGGRISHIAVAVIGAGSVAISTILSLMIAVSFIRVPPPNNSYLQIIWTWMSVEHFRPTVGFYLDALSLVMVLVVTFVGLVIHIYSAEFMACDEGYSRFFAYMNLFIASMLILVLADNLLFLYLGWEGVGLCSYLLIGFWYEDPSNAKAAIKAFLVTRVGDTAMTIGLFLLFVSFGTLQIQPLMQKIAQYPAGSAVCVAAAALLLGSALGKSAQLPLQTWLPDAMAGPTPVSALIHAATMVTAGVYLIARTHVLFTQAPVIQSAVAVIGAATLLLAGFSALTQHDIKRVLAYSTISQIGYMFLALGVGAWAAAIFHFMIHAFFKSLLFLSAGVVIIALDHEHNIFKMGGLRRQMPLAFYTFLIGCASLSAIPVVTAGFYSKDMILSQVWFSQMGGPSLWFAGLVGAFLTSVYSFRALFIVFCGEKKTDASYCSGIGMALPLVILAILAIIGGLINLPPTLGNAERFSRFLHSALPALAPGETTLREQYMLLSISSAVSLAGLYCAYLLFLQKPQLADDIVRSKFGTILHRFWFSDWGFDWLYDKVFVQPYVWFARFDKNDFIDSFFNGIGRLNEGLHYILAATQNGNVRWYVAVIVLGTVLILGLAILI